MAISSQVILKFAIGAALAGFLVFLLRSKAIKGWFGELTVNLLARFYLDKKNYHILRNVTLPTEDSTTQIDHIIVSKFGIFVVETKNMSGWIYGSEQDAEWTQQIYKHKNTFQNPLRQHYRHTKVLEEILGVMPGRVFSLIVFVGKSTFKNKVPKNITHARGYIDHIKSKTEPLFGEFEVLDLVKKIQEYRLEPGLETHRAHLINLEKKYPGKIRRKLRSAKPTSPLYKYAVLAALLVAFVVVAKRTVIDQEDEITYQTADGEATVPSSQPEKSPAQQELNKIYQYQDAQGRTRYTNIATAPDAKPVNGDMGISKSPLSIEIRNNRVLIPVTISNKGTQIQTKLFLDETSPVTIVPMATADFIESEKLGTLSVTISNGKAIEGEKRKASYFAVGETTEPNFLFLATDTREFSNTGVLGMDFITRHPFIIDQQKLLLIWK